MEVQSLEISGLKIINPDIFKDSRGYFFESFNLKKYKKNGLNLSFVQDNESNSSYGVIRGLHFQTGEFAQGKLVRVVKGKVLDVAVDIRVGSPTFGKYFSIMLNSENKLQFWIPPGFAHGYSVLSEEAIFHYKCTNYYSKEHEVGIIYNDPQLAIDWKIENPVLSEKDLNYLELKDIPEYFHY